MKPPAVDGSLLYLGKEVRRSFIVDNLQFVKSVGRYWIVSGSPWMKWKPASPFDRTFSIILQP